MRIFLRLNKKLLKKTGAAFWGYAWTFWAMLLKSIFKIMCASFELVFNKLL